MPILPGSDGPVDSEEKALKIAKDLGLPVIIKAVAGGGGRGMRVIRDMKELRKSLKTAQREAEAAFGVGDVYIEKYVENPRHIEFQVLGDHHGAVVHLGERECSIQRRHQKLLEEGPSVAVTEKMRRKLGGTVVDAARGRAVHQRRHLRVPARRQGQLLLPRGQHARAGRAPGDRVRHRRRHRQGADPDRGGRAAVVQAGGRDVRRATRSSAASTPRIPRRSRRRPASSTRSACPAGPASASTRSRTPECTVSPYYDSMIAKIIVHGRDRQEAIARMRRTLEMTVIDGIKTSIPLHLKILADPDFIAGRLEHLLHGALRDRKK